MRLVEKFIKGKTRKSAGVRVTPAVHDLIFRADGHRDARAWARAATLYRQALAIDSGLIHIWVQLGHMLKEARSALEACDAYLNAFRLDPKDPALLGWLYDIAGRLAPDRRRALIHDIDRIRGMEPRHHVMRHDNQEKPRENEIIFDVSDLVAYFTRARRPTGIQRVQIEIINASLELETDIPVRICCSVEQSSYWVEIETALFRYVTTLAVSEDASDDAVWRDAIGDVNAALVFGSDFVFGTNAHLINLGTSWWLRNYFLQVRNGQWQNGIEYIPFIHDLIPVLAPHHCVQGLVEDFNSWILGVFDHADRFLVNSHATKNDLLHVARLLGRSIEDHAVTVVPLDGAFALPDIASPSPALARAGLSGKHFILFVSTIESRKGHLVALRAWRRLLDDHGHSTPYLVCVGNNGWLNQEFYDLLDQDAALKERVILLSGIADTDLAFLYRTCLFTIYPSTYEGWGLPVTEALTCGKIVVAADNSSLPEAGGEHAVYTRTGDDVDLAEKVAHFAFDEEAREAKERDIQAGYRPRSWSMIARQIIDQAASRSSAQAKKMAPGIMPGQWCDLRRDCDLHIRKGAGSAERLRSGTGWESPDHLGCWIKENQAELRFHVPPTQPCTVALKMYCRSETLWSIHAGEHLVDEGCASRAGDFWAICHILRPDKVVSLTIRTSSLGQSDPEVGSILGVRGCVLLPDDQEASQKLMWSILFDRLDRGSSGFEDK